ncbi:hypothetical protein DTO166G4_7275 [Paecilomyces variotii]|nr:hypothetical protein DTO166G4_7275 [Paecilomyces variotii]KAJ9230181.1 hypothetical protein DTO166G5_7438 [Paecilomyces variotii]
MTLWFANYDSSCSAERETASRLTLTLGHKATREPVSLVNLILKIPLTWRSADPRQPPGFLGIHRARSIGVTISTPNIPDEVGEIAKPKQTLKERVISKV